MFSDLISYDGSQIIVQTGDLLETLSGVLIVAAGAGLVLWVVSWGVKRLAVFLELRRIQRQDSEDYEREAYRD